VSVFAPGNCLGKHFQKQRKLSLEVAVLQPKEKTAPPKQTTTFLRNINQGM
jgi:hypothetical protein